MKLPVIALGIGALGALAVAGPLARAQAPQAPPAPPVTIRAETLIDGRGGVMKDVVIRVENGRIVSVGRSTAKASHSFPGVTIMPGWIDTHVHLASHFNKDGRYDTAGEPPAQLALYSAENAWLMLQAGFTTVQSLGTPSDVDLRAAIARGSLPGPRVLTSVRQIMFNGTAGQTIDGPATADQLRAAVRSAKTEGADVIKLFASGSIRDGGRRTMTDAQLQAVCGEATAVGLRSVVHVYTADAMRDATLAGCTSIEHGAFASDDVFRLMAARGTYFDPQIGLLLQNYLEKKPQFFGIGNFNDEGYAYMEKAIPAALDAFKRALKVPGLKIVFGTDANAGAHGRNAEEAIARVRVGGQSPMAAIAAMTSLAAEALRLQDHIGVIAPGMDADLVGVVGDPLANIDALKHVVFVMRGGRIYKTTE